MTIKDIIKTTATYLGREEIIAYLSGETEEFSQENISRIEKEVEILVRCANLVINELATEYAPLKSMDTVNSLNGQIVYNSLPNDPLDILNVYDIYGNKLSFSLTPYYIKTKPEAVKIEYTYIPHSYSLDETIAYEEKQMPERVIAYGVATEVSLIEGRFEEAGLWEKRFKDSVLNVVMPKRTVIKGRYWR